MERFMQNFENTIKFLEKSGIKIYQDELNKHSTGEDDNSQNLAFTNTIWYFREQAQETGKFQVIFVGFSNNGYGNWSNSYPKKAIYLEPEDQWNKGRDSNFVVKMPENKKQQESLLKIIEILDFVDRNRMDYFIFPEWTCDPETGSVIGCEEWDEMRGCCLYGNACDVLKGLERFKKLHDFRIKELKENFLYDAYIENVKEEMND